MEAALAGAFATVSFVAGLFFLRFHRQTKDRFFLLFALSFWIEGANRLLLHFVVGANEEAPLHYIVRLVAYALILVAIVDKNRPGGR